MVLFFAFPIRLPKLWLSILASFDPHKRRQKDVLGLGRGQGPGARGQRPEVAVDVSEEERN